MIENYFYPDNKSAARSFLLTAALVGISLTISLLTCDLGFVMEVTVSRLVLPCIYFLGGSFGVGVR